MNFETFFIEFLFKIIAPKLLFLVNNINQTEGTKSQIFCAVQSGSPPLFFQWFKNDRILVPNPESNFRIDTSQENSNLIIAKLHRSDSGNYSCLVRNTFGSDSQSVLLNVRGIEIFF
jgi:hypothetical protein